MRLLLITTEISLKVRRAYKVSESTMDRTACQPLWPYHILKPSKSEKQ